MFYLLNASVAQAGKPDTAVFTCPEKYILIGETCRSIHQIDLVPYCNDDDATLVGDKCHKYADLLATCEIGKFDASSDSCYEKSVTAPFILCPDDYTLVVGSKKNEKEDEKEKMGYCEKVIPFDGSHVCPWGTLREGNRCASYSKVTPFWDCPEGSQPNGLFCVFAEEYDCSEPSLTHSKKNKDKRRLGSEDTKMQIYQPGSDFAVSQIVSFQRKCVKETTVPAVMQCPEGSYQRDTDCVIVSYYEPEQTKGDVMYDSTPAEVVCPADFQFCDTFKNGGMCCKVETSKPYRQCPNYYNQQGNECIHTYDATFICPTQKKLRKGNVCDGYDWLPATVSLTMPVSDSNKKRAGLHVVHHGKY